MSTGSSGDPCPSKRKLHKGQEKRYPGAEANNGPNDRRQPKQINRCNRKVSSISKWEREGLVMPKKAAKRTTKKKVAAKKKTSKKSAKKKTSKKKATKKRSDRPRFGGGAKKR